jgi:hypothetical protein
MKVRLEYNPTQPYPFHFAGTYEVANTFGWSTIKEGIDENVANAFVREAIKKKPRPSVKQMKEALTDWLLLHI